MKWYIDLNRTSVLSIQTHDGMLKNEVTSKMDYNGFGAYD
eukprot:CAMPEP_0185798072 /NCGR_PEP_ID=MMETSP1174-20130828/161952_1 /TAXON_ID=35687 /ORGANISM="Dictyocha speculum, Strain CCMP1381" /LENGTH=39 /DNA_ID= /DNA_START= /DNA_END= /DNA_ORIENTATION=